MDPAVLEQLQHVPLRRYAAEALKIANKDGDIVPLDVSHRPGQIKLLEAISRQEAAGLPVRVILVKSRQFGGSTAIQGYMFKKANTRGRRRILTVAQKMRTAESLFGMGEVMYQHLPANMRHPIAGFANPTRGEKIMHFGEKIGGFIGGLDSKLSTDTAEEVAGGRGLTYTDLHLTECAHWRDAKKALDLLPAVPKRPGTSIFLESTANGLNWFHGRFKAAMEGLSEYEAVFVGWHEDPDCVRAFRTPQERAEFVESIGDTAAAGVMAEDEPWLQQEFGCTPEQLYFRRTAIVDECDGKVELFRQEYPATWTEAFIGSGRQVFSVVFTQRMAKEAEHWSRQPPEAGGPQEGILVGSEPVTRKLSDGEVEVPTKVLWVPKEEIPARCEWWPGQFHDPKDPLWTVWLPRERSAEEWRLAHEAGDVDLEEMEQGMAAALRPRQCIVAGDAAGDTFNGVPSQLEEHAFNTLVGIDHWTGVQVAQWRGRVDHDLVARRAFLIGMFLNEALVSIERTGGYGNVMLDLLQRRYYYRRLHTEKVLDDKKQREINRLGWDTNRRSKPQMEGTAQALLREGTHGIRSPLLASEFQTYVKDEKNPAKHEPSAGAFSDLLLAWMQAQEIRRQRPPRPAPPRDGHRPNSMVRRIAR
jgi:hypothetical protein